MAIIDSEKWTCEKCRAVLVYEVKKGKAKFTSINKQKTNTGFVFLEAACKKCGLKQTIKSENILKIYNMGLNDGLKIAHATANEFNPDFPLHEGGINWSRNSRLEDKIISELDEDNKKA